MANDTGVVYLHGFASGPQSRKARFFVEHLQARGIPCEVPDLAGDDFEGLTISKQLAALERSVVSKPTILIGSSLGGYLAALFAARRPSQIQALVLLAPAFHFVDLWRKQMDPCLWRRWEEGELVSVFHYALGREARLRFDLMRDAADYPPEPSFAQPALLFHGLRDDTVPVASSIEFARKHPNVRLTTLDSGHELTDVLPAIWAESREFLTKSVLHY